MGLAGYPSRATEDPVPTERVPEILQEWGFGADENGWRHWPVSLKEVNPDLEMIGRGPNWSLE